MAETPSKIAILTRREIEARIAEPLIRAFIDEFGRDRTLALVDKVIRALSHESGQQVAKQMGGNSIACFSEGLKNWAADDAYETEVLELSDTKYFYNVKRCRYAEMYKEFGMADIGVALSCNRDFEMVKGFNPRMNLVRTKTIMEGHDHCDFRITLD